MTSRDPKMREQGAAGSRKTPDPKYPGPSASLVENEETPENTEMDPNDPEPAAKGGIQMGYSSD
jgi:hypothetical protein